MFPKVDSTLHSRYIEKDWEEVADIRKCRESEDIKRRSTLINLPHSELSKYYEEKYAIARSREEKCFQDIYARCSSRYKALKKRRDLVDNWERDNASKRAECEKEDRARALREQRDAERQTYIREREDENKRIAQDYLNDFQLSQQALQVMLKSGTITVPPRENPAYKCCPELYNSSSSEVVIELVPVRSRDDFRTVSCTDKELINSRYELKDLSLDLRKCPNLTSIVGKKLGTKGAKLLSQYISFGDTNKLRSLSLSWNSINTYGLNSLIPSLAQNCHALEFLDLKGNSITSDGINCIEQAFKSKLFSSLQTLDLSLNPIGSEGVFAISKILFQELLPHSFKLLSVRGCKIDENGMRALLACCKCLSSNKSKNVTCKEVLVIATKNMPAADLKRKCSYYWPTNLKV